MNKRTGKVIRAVAIVLLGLTAAMNLLGGIGTTCAAFGFKPEYRVAFSELQDFLWLYQILVVTTILIGIGGVWVIVTLARGRRNAFRNTMVVLGIGTILAGIHYYASQTLRGAAAPANMKFYINALTLVVFYLIRNPKIWQRADDTVDEETVDNVTAGGLAAIVAGYVVLSVPAWAGASHTLNGQNWVSLLQNQLVAVGTVLILGGVVLLLRVVLSLMQSALFQPSLSHSKRSTS